MAYSHALHIGIIGARGIPALYGGFETFAERLSLGLRERGHRVTVYCSSSSCGDRDKVYKGIRRVMISNVALKSLDKFSSSFLSCLHSAFISYDVILFLGVGPVLFAWLPRGFGKKTVININGLEWKRQKWNRFASFYLRLSERLSGLFCHKLVTDSKGIQKYFKEAYGRQSAFIAYGADIGSVENEAVLTRYGLKKTAYFLQVCRLEPENNSHVVIEEYKKLDTHMPLAVLGDAPYADAYKKTLHKIANERVKFLGSVYGYDYDVIRSNAFCYIHAHEVGGTNPALLEALAAGNCVVVLDVPFNLEVIGSAGLSFSKEPGSLKDVLNSLLTHPEIIPRLRRLSTQRVEEHYTWDKVVNDYEKLFYKLVVKRRNAAGKCR